MLDLLRRRLFSKRRQSSGNSDSADPLPHVQTLSELLRDSSDEELLTEANHLRRQFSRGRAFYKPEMLIAGVALASEALRRAHGITLFDVQLQAVLSLGLGAVVQMQTGEGKTFVAVTVACHLALSGRGVHVITPKAYLAERDCETAAAVLQRLEMNAGLLPEGGDNDPKRTACDCEYGTGHEFGFDYLRDQLTLRQQADAALGTKLFEDLCRPKSVSHPAIQEGLAFAVADEADSVLIRSLSN